MATIQQIRGMLFEEAVLFLLARAGYRTIDVPDGRTIRPVGAGLAVCGRGGMHQIDAIADYEIVPPFGYPQRLLVEAKFYSSRVELPIIRNAVGVLKDVNEFWHPSHSILTGNRYHYLQAVFSASEFTSAAEDYAFAQDVYLFPLAKSAYFHPLLSAISSIKPQTFGGIHWSSVPVNLSRLRQEIRSMLRDPEMLYDYDRFADGRERDLFQFVDVVYRLGGVVVGMLGRSFPLFLVPRTPAVLDYLRGDITVQVWWDDTSWYLRSPDGEGLFSFDIPPRLFARYAKSGLLTRQHALDLKRDFFSDLHAVIVEPNAVRVVRFQLDGDWIERLLAEVQHRRPDVVENAEAE
jgi:hypothetical protein